MLNLVFSFALIFSAHIAYGEETSKTSSSKPGWLLSIGEKLTDIDPEFVKTYDGEMKEARKHFSDPNLGDCQNTAIANIAKTLNKNSKFYKLLYEQAVLKSAILIHQESNATKEMDLYLSEQSRKIADELKSSVQNDHETARKLKDDLHSIYGRFGYISDVQSINDTEKAQSKIIDALNDSDGDLTRGSAYLLVKRYTQSSARPGNPKINLSDAAIVWANEYSEDRLNEFRDDEEESSRKEKVGKKQFFKDVDAVLSSVEKNQRNLEETSKGISKNLDDQIAQTEKLLKQCLEANPEYCKSEISQEIKNFKNSHEEIKQRLLLEHFLEVEQQLMAKQESGVKPPTWAIKMFQKKWVQKVAYSGAKTLKKLGDKIVESKVETSQGAPVSANPPSVE